jgi:hypothetical protein
MRVVLSGGAGFLDVLRHGHNVAVYDNLGRPATETNLAWLRSRDGDRLRSAT